jgi:hypothetical protein
MDATKAVPSVAAISLFLDMMDYLTKDQGETWLAVASQEVTTTDDAGLVGCAALAVFHFGLVSAAFAFTALAVFHFGFVSAAFAFTALAVHLGVFFGGAALAFATFTFTALAFFHLLGVTVVVLGHHIAFFHAGQGEGVFGCRCQRGGQGCGKSGTYSSGDQGLLGHGVLS